ncbi:MAG: 30S ribosomal protein S17 [Thermoleophilia bacterium]
MPEERQDTTAEAGTAAPADEAADRGLPEKETSKEGRSRRRLSRAQPRPGRKPARSQEEGRSPIVRPPKPEKPRGKRQERRGVVVSAAMDKTIVVRVDTVKAHPRYKKIIRRSTKFHAHDERNEAKVGDIVRIVETRPLSRTKRWRLAEIIEVAK